MWVFFFFSYLTQQVISLPVSSWACSVQYYGMQSGENEEEEFQTSAQEAKQKSQTRLPLRETRSMTLPRPLGVGGWGVNFKFKYSLKLGFMRLKAIARDCSVNPWYSVSKSLSPGISRVILRQFQEDRDYRLPVTDGDAGTARSHTYAP